MRKFITTLTFFAAAIAVYAPLVRAQSVSQVYTVTLASGAGTTVSSDFRNVGQSAHQFYACLTLNGGTTSGSAELELEASSDDVHFFAITSQQPIATPATTGFLVGCTTLSGEGYYGAVRLAIFSPTASGGLDPSITLTGFYTGSAGAAPIGGESRASSAATKVSFVPSTATYIDATLKSTPDHVVTAPGGPTTVGNFVYGVMVENPNSATPVYVQIGNNATVSTSPQLIVPVAGSGVVTLTLPSPVYSSQNLYVACSTSATSAVDPSTGCFVELLYTSQNGANSQVAANGNVLNTDNSAGSIPH